VAHVELGDNTPICRWITVRSLPQVASWKVTPSDAVAEGKSFTESFVTPTRSEVVPHGKP